MSQTVWVGAEPSWGDLWVLRSSSGSESGGQRSEFYLHQDLLWLTGPHEPVWIRLKASLTDRLLFPAAADKASVLELSEVTEPHQNPPRTLTCVWQAISVFIHHSLVWMFYLNKEVEALGSGSGSVCCEFRCTSAGLCWSRVFPACFWFLFWV